MATKLEKSNGNNAMATTLVILMAAKQPGQKAGNYRNTWGSIGILGAGHEI